jgi:3-oxoacyl-[acyl-carrier-protein] synthase-1
VSASDLVVTAMGGVTAVGATIAQSCAAIRAGIGGVREHPFELFGPDPDWDPYEELAAALVPTVDLGLAGPARAVALAKLALEDLVGSARLRRGELARAALLVALPSPADTAGPWGLRERFVPALVARGGLADFADARVDDSGRCAFFRQLALAGELVRQGAVERCVLLAVDTYHEHGRLRHLDESHRLLSERSPDGFRPGEAAVAFLCEARAGLRPALVALRRTSFASEPRPFTSELQSSARGLSAAVERAAGKGTVPWVLSDLNGESYRAFEWGMLQARLADRFEAMTRLDHPADCTGDVGAATGALLLACVAHAYSRRAAPAPSALLYVGADDGLRAAATVERPS